MPDTTDELLEKLNAAATAANKGAMTAGLEALNPDRVRKLWSELDADELHAIAQHLEGTASRLRTAAAVMLQALDKPAIKAPA